MSLTGRRGTLAACSIWSSRWNAAAAARRRPLVEPARGSFGRANRTTHLITARDGSRGTGFSLGRYAGARATAIVAVKEHGRADLIDPLGAALRMGAAAADMGGLGAPLTVVPAPTRRHAARRRGGDPSSAWRYGHIGRPRCARSSRPFG